MSSPFNQLTPAEVERLALLAEECAETIQAIQKILRHGYESTYPINAATNRRAIEKEIGHIENAVAMMADAGDLDASSIEISHVFKKDSIAQWLHHQ